MYSTIVIDGDGMIVALTFSQGRVHLRCKFVASKHRLEEQKECKFLYRGQMGTHPSSALTDTIAFLGSAISLQWPRLIYRNPSNTNVFHWGGKVHNIVICAVCLAGCSGDIML